VRLKRDHDQLSPRLPAQLAPDLDDPLMTAVQPVKIPHRHHAAKRRRPQSI
jgi:hypothetical protein